MHVKPAHKNPLLSPSSVAKLRTGRGTQEVAATLRLSRQGRETPRACQRECVSRIKGTGDASHGR